MWIELSEYVCKDSSTGFISSLVVQRLHVYDPERKVPIIFQAKIGKHVWFLLVTEKNYSISEERCACGMLE